MLIDDSRIRFPWPPCSDGPLAGDRPQIGDDVEDGAPPGAHPAREHIRVPRERSGRCELQALAYRLGSPGPRSPYLWPLRETDASRVGPLSRVNACDFIDTPEAEAARVEFRSLTGGRPCQTTMAYHWARMIEVLHAIEKTTDLLRDPDLQGTDLVTRGDRRSDCVGVIEAPRGTLFHHYRVGDDDLVTMCNLIVSTTSNNEAMNRSVRAVAEQRLGGRAEITEPMLNSIEVVIRAYDPCLSCATHALGRMPLLVELIAPGGEVIDRRTRGEP